MADFYDSIGFTATGDAGRALGVVGSGGITGYREWLWNTLYGYGYEAEDLNVQAGWSGWNSMTATFNLNVLCGRNVGEVRENIASILAYAEIMLNPTVSSSQTQTEGCPSDWPLISIGNIDGGTVYANNPPVASTPPSGDKKGPFEELTAWLKANQTEAMMAGLLLVVVLVRK